MAQRLVTNGEARKEVKQNRRSLPVRVHARTEHPARTPQHRGGTQLGSSHRRVRRRGGCEGARQGDFGRRHFGLLGCASHHPSMKHWGLYPESPLGVGDVGTNAGPRGCCVPPPGENGAVSYR